MWSAFVVKAVSVSVVALALQPGTFRIKPFDKRRKKVALGAIDSFSALFGHPPILPNRPQQKRELVLNSGTPLHVSGGEDNENRPAKSTGCVFFHNCARFSPPPLAGEVGWGLDAQRQG